MFDLDKLMTTTPFDVCAIDVTLQDARSGDIIKRTIYLPGKIYPYERINKEFTQYGYKVLSVGEPGNCPGQINWAEVFGAFIQQEPVTI